MARDDLPAVDKPWAIDVPDFDRWVAGAKPGERLLYAAGASIPRHEPAWAHAAALRDDGVVTLCQGRDPADARRFRYFADRVAAPIAAEPAPAAATIDEDDPQALVLRELRRAARLGLACPKNDEIARRCGLKDAAAASYRIRLLVADGAVRVDDRGPRLPRVVTILTGEGRGKRTAAAWPAPRLGSRVA